MLGHYVRLEVGLCFVLCLTICVFRDAKNLPRLQVARESKNKGSDIAQRIVLNTESQIPILSVNHVDIRVIHANDVY